MRLLPCGYCGTYALHPATQRFPQGMPAIMGSPSSTPDGYIDVHCFRCGGAAKNPGVSTSGRVLPRTTRLSLVDLNRIPEMTYEDFVRLGFKDMATRDLEGSGMAQKHAVDLFRQGWTVEELHSLSRDVEP